MKFAIQEFTLNDYDDVLEFWKKQQGVGLNESDSREQIGKFLARNPGLSLVVRDNGRVIGAVLCGHDGRRGFLHHLAVDPEYRHRGIGRQMVLTCLDALRSQGIQKCNIWVYTGNAEGQKFWRAIGFGVREDLRMMQSSTDNRKAS